MIGDVHFSPRIGIDASSVVGLRTGIGHATAALLGGMTQCWPADWAPLRVWVNSPRHPLPSQDPWLRSACISLRTTRLPGRPLLRSWEYLNAPAVERLTGRLDLIHAPASYIPPVKSARRVVTVHDLYFKYAPEHVEPYGGAYFARTFERRLAGVDHIIAVSDFTRRELLKFYPLEPERITVVPQAVDRHRFAEARADDDKASLRTLGIEQPYLLCVATIEPRKNLITLIEGYARARRILEAGGQKLPRLVIAGQAGWGLRAVEARLGEAGMRDAIRLTGYVCDETLPALYRHALGFVFPSVYEGFGMPVLEAMACGCPCAVARAGSLPEVAGNAAIYFKPDDSNSLARVIARFVAEPHLRLELRDLGRGRAALFNWDFTARATMNVYRKVLGLPLEALEALPATDPEPDTGELAICS